MPHRKDAKIWASLWDNIIYIYIYYREVTVILWKKNGDGVGI